MSLERRNKAFILQIFKSFLDVVILCHYEAVGADTDCGYRGEALSRDYRGFSLFALPSNRMSGLHTSLILSQSQILE